MFSNITNFVINVILCNFNASNVIHFGKNYNPSISYMKIGFIINYLWKKVMSLFYFCTKIIINKRRPRPRKLTLE